MSIARAALCTNCCQISSLQSRLASMCSLVHLQGMGREDGDRERKASISAGADDVWRPAGPPGLARGAAQRIAPPGLGAPGNNTHERPWGSGEGSGLFPTICFDDNA